MNLLCNFNIYCIIKSRKNNKQQHLPKDLQQHKPLSSAEFKITLAKSAFLGKNSTFTQRNSVRVVLKIF